jgi:hypothetical protein
MFNKAELPSGLFESLPEHCFGCGDVDMLAFEGASRRGVFITLV